MEYICVFTCSICSLFPLQVPHQNLPHAENQLEELSCLPLSLFLYDPRSNSEFLRKRIYSDCQPKNLMQLILMKKDFKAGLHKFSELIFYKLLLSKRVGIHATGPNDKQFKTQNTFPAKIRSFRCDEYMCLCQLQSCNLTLPSYGHI